MAIEVVGRDVEQHPALGRKRVGVLELKARALADHRGLRRCFVDERGERSAHVAGDRHGRPSDAPRVPEQFDHRRLAVRSGDAHERVRQQPPGELELADDRKLRLQGALDRGRLPGNTGALHDAARPLDQVDAV
jgi:hypothetical protein